MSIRIMSAIFETEFFDLPMGEDDENGKPRRVKASSAKLVLLALADHTNDDGEGAYPGLTRLERKTGLSRSGLVDILSGLKFNGLIFAADELSKLNTVNYTINVASFPNLLSKEEHRLLVKPLDQSSHFTSDSKATLPEVVKPLDLNHQLTIKQPSSAKKPKLPKGSDIGFALAAGYTNEELVELNADAEFEREHLAFYEHAMGYGTTLDWWNEKGELPSLRKFLLGKSREDIETFARWCKRQYSKFRPEDAIRWPRRVIEFWPMAFENREEEYPVKKFVPKQEDESQYIPNPREK